MSRAMGVGYEALSRLFERWDFMCALQGLSEQARQAGASGFSLFERAGNIAVTNMIPARSVNVDTPCNPGEVFRQTAAIYCEAVLGIVHMHRPAHRVFRGVPEVPTLNDLLADQKIRTEHDLPGMIGGVLTYDLTATTVGRLTLTRPRPLDTAGAALEPVNVAALGEGWSDDPRHNQQLIEDCGLNVGYLSFNASTGAFAGPDAELERLFTPAS